jgi:hypothetical protein
MATYRRKIVLADGCCVPRRISVKYGLAMVLQVLFNENEFLFID